MKNIIKIAIGIIVFFILEVILNMIIIDYELVNQISFSLLITYFLILTIIPYIRNSIQYLKNNELPNKAPLLKFIDALLGNKIFKLIMYTLFYSSIWCFQGYLLYHTAFDIYALDTISNNLLSASFILLVLPILIILLQITGVSLLVALPNTNETNKEIRMSKDLIIKLIQESVSQKLPCIIEFIYNNRRHSIGVAYYNEYEIIYFLDNQEFREFNKFLNEAKIKEVPINKINEEFIIKQFNSYNSKEIQQIKNRQTLIKTK